MTRYKKNMEVIVAWMSGSHARSRPMWTDGDYLFSCGLKIGGTIGGKKILYNYSGAAMHDAQGHRVPGVWVSKATTIHIKLAAKYADIIVEPPTVR